jgi:hypothetical protein
MRPNTEHLKIYLLPHIAWILTANLTPLNHIRYIRFLTGCCKGGLLNTFFGFACLHTGLQQPGLEAYRDSFNTSFMTFLYRRRSMPGCFASQCNLGEPLAVLWGCG